MPVVPELQTEMLLGESTICFFTLNQYNYQTLITHFNEQITSIFDRRNLAPDWRSHLGGTDYNKGLYPE